MTVLIRNTTIPTKKTEIQHGGRQPTAVDIHILSRRGC